MKGKIIAVVGAPGCGKSYLVKKLAEYYNGLSILEGEEKDMPKRVIEDLTKRHRNLELFIWFHNKLMREIVIAQKNKNKGNIVVMDTFWLTNECYIKSFFKGFESQLTKDIYKSEREILPYPDKIIFLRASERTIRELIRKRGRKFDNNEEFIKMTVEVDKEHKTVLKGLKNVIMINRDGIDFDKDLSKIIRKIKL